MSKKIKIGELDNQINNSIPGGHDGVLVKLAFPDKMNNTKFEKDYHIKLGHRVWMLNEIEVLTDKDVQQLSEWWTKH